MKSAEVSRTDRRGRIVLAMIRWIRRFNTTMHHLAGAALVGMLALTVVDITRRTVFNNPVPGTVEVTALVLVVVVFLGLAHSEDLGDHITVDLLYVRVGDRFKVVLDIVANVLSVGVLAVMAFQLYHFALRQQETGAESPVLEWPVWPFVIVAAFGSVLYALSIAFKLVLRAMGEPTEALEPGRDEVSGVEI